MASVPGPSDVEPAAQDEAAPDAGGDDDAEHIGPAAASAPPVLAHGEADAVAGEPDGVPGHERGDLLPERKVPPGRDIDRAHGADPMVNRAGRADPDAEEGARSVRQQPGDQAGQGRPGLLAGRGTLRCSRTVPSTSTQAADSLVPPTSIARTSASVLTSWCS